MATGERSYQWSTAGLTVTACQAPRRISCRKTSRQSHEQLRETRAVSITILFVLVPIGAIIAWWLSQQRLTAKPWLEVGAIDDFIPLEGRGDFLESSRILATETIRT